MYIAEASYELTLPGQRDETRLTTRLQTGMPVGGSIKSPKRSTEPAPPIDNFNGNKGAHLAHASRSWNYVRQPEKVISYASEHMRMKPVIDQVRRLSAFSADPAGLYEFISAGFNLYCTPDDHPDGERDFAQAEGQGKPISLVARVNWHFEDEKITGLDIRMESLGESAWAIKKIRELFEMTEVPIPIGKHINS